MATKPAPTLDPTKTRPVGDLPDGTEFRIFHLKRGCKAKGEWSHYAVDYARNDRQGHIAAAFLPRSSLIAMTRMMNPDTPVEVVGDLPVPPPGAVEATPAPPV